MIPGIVAAIRTATTAIKLLMTESSESITTESGDPITLE